MVVSILHSLIIIREGVQAGVAGLNLTLVDFARMHGRREVRNMNRTISSRVTIGEVAVVKRFTDVLQLLGQLVIVGLEVFTPLDAVAAQLGIKLIKLLCVLHLLVWHHGWVL